jgi:hypothetical protein
LRKTAELDEDDGATCRCIDPKKCSIGNSRSPETACSGDTEDEQTPVNG